MTDDNATGKLAPTRKPRTSKKAAKTPSGPVASKPEASASTPPAAKPPPVYVAGLTVRWRDLDAFNHVNNAA